MNTGRERIAEEAAKAYWSHSDKSMKDRHTFEQGALWAYDKLNAEWVARCKANGEADAELIDVLQAENDRLRKYIGDRAEVLGNKL